MDLSVVVVNWNSGSHLAALMASLHPISDELESIVVVDNASVDGSEQAAGDCPKAILLRNERNLGFAAGANQGICAVQTAWVLLLNPDIILNAEAVRGVFAGVQLQPRAAVASCALRDSAGGGQAGFQLRSLPSLNSVVKDALFIDEVENWLGVRNETRDPGPMVEQPAAAFWLLRKEAWTLLGGFDERFYPAWFEDVDFCKRLKDASWKLCHFPEFSVEHAGGHSLRNLSYRQFMRVFYGNLLLYWRKHHPASYPLVWPAVMIGLGFRLLIGRW